MAPTVSVIVCTYERPEHLRTCLSALCEQTCSHQYEIIVVDGARSTATRDVANSVRSADCTISYLIHTVGGLSAARNIGYKKAAGEYVLYLDDDAVPATDWIEGLLTGLDGGAELVVGPARPPKEYQRPAWLSPDLEAYLGFFDMGEQPQTIPPGTVTGTGTNMGFDRRALVELGGFDERLGRQNGNLLSREDLDLFRRADAAGMTCEYVPVPVTHAVESKNLTKRFFRRRLFYEGISEFREFWPKRPEGLIKKTVKLGLRVPYHTLRFCHAAMTGDETARFSYYCRLLEAYGFISAPLR